MDELGGRPHWGKRHFQTAATLRARYPDWDRFQAVRARLDPDGRFANAWTERVLGPVDEPPACAARCDQRPAPVRLGQPPLRAAGARDRRACRRRSRWSTSTRCGRTPPTCERRAAGKPIRLASKSVRCRALQERVLATRGSRHARVHAARGAVARLPRRRGPGGRLSDRRPRRAARARGAHRRAAGRPRGDGDGRQRRAARADRPRDRRSRSAPAARLHRRRRRLAGARRSRARRRQALADAHARAGRGAGARDPRPRRPAPGRDHVLRGADRRSRRHAAGAAAARPRDPRAAGASARELAVRRAAVVAAVEAVLSDASAPPLELVNGGGTGSLERPPRSRR